MKTLPWMNDPVLMLKPSVFWIANRLRNARTAWLAPNDPAAPLLVLKLNGRYGQMAVDPYTRTALAIWSRLRVSSRRKHPMSRKTASRGGSGR